MWGGPVFLKESEEEEVMVGRVIGFYQVHKSNVGPKGVVTSCVKKAFQGE
jgi:hypothetical protein